MNVVRLNKAQAIKRDDRIIKQLFVAFLFGLVMSAMLIPTVKDNFDTERNAELLLLKCQTSLCTDVDYDLGKRK